MNRIDAPGVEKNPLREGGLSRVNMSRDTNVAHLAHVLPVRGQRGQCIRSRRMNCRLLSDVPTCVLMPRAKDKIGVDVRRQNAPASIPGLAAACRSTCRAKSIRPPISGTGAWRAGTG